MKSTFLYFLTLVAWLYDQPVMGQVSLGNLALTNVSIIDANHPRPLANQTVLIEGGIIKNVFNDGAKPIAPTYQILNLSGKFILPGLIDTHVHMATDPSGIDNRANTLAVLERMLYTGVTVVRDMAGDARTLASLSRDALNGDIVSPDIYYSALMAGKNFFSDPRTSSSTKGAVSGSMPYMLAVSDSTDMPLAVAAAKGTGASGIKIYANLPPLLVGKIVREANKQNIIVWGHAWVQQSKPSELIAAGVSSISHAPILVREKIDKIPDAWKRQHTRKYWDEVTPDLISVFALMKQKGTILDATLLTYKRLSDSDTSRRYNYEIGKRFTAAAYRAGVVVCAGTDDDQEAFVQEEMKLLVKEAGFTPIDAIIAATLNGAKALHIEDTRGTISVGKVADLLVLDKNPLINMEDLNSVYLVVKKGYLFKK